MDLTGALYIADTRNHRVRRVAPDGTITTVAGGGAPPTGNGDGGQATDALLDRPVKLAVTPDGLVMIADEGENRIRRVGQAGDISTVVGGGSDFMYGGAASQYALQDVRGIAVAPTTVSTSPTALRCSTSTRRSVATSTRTSRSLRRTVGPANQFDSNGRHLRTPDAITADVRMSFTYANGLLASFTDASGNTTRIERDGASQPTAIVAPGGQRTLLTVGGGGWLTTYQRPGGAQVKLEDTAGGLMTKLTDPLDRVHAFSYDSQGRLIKDDPPGPQFTTLTREETPTTSTVHVRDALAHETAYTTQRLTTGGYRRTVTNSAGGEEVVFQRSDGTQEEITPEGVHHVMQLGPDPRWGCSRRWRPKPRRAIRAGWRRPSTSPAAPSCRTPPTRSRSARRPRR